MEVTPLIYFIIPQFEAKGLLSTGILCLKALGPAHTTPGAVAKGLMARRGSSGVVCLDKGKRYVPEKEYIHMISSYITADWSNIE